MTKYEKWQLWDRLFGWPVKWKKEWKYPYKTSNIPVERDDPDMPF